MGASSVWSLQPNLTKPACFSIEKRSDQDAIALDWAVVGNELRDAMAVAGDATLKPHAGEA